MPAVVRTTDDVGSVEQALVENLHRQDLTPLEEAAAYQQLIEDFGLTHEDVARRVGKSRSAITNTLRLLGLPPAVQHCSPTAAVGRPRPGPARDAGPLAPGAARPPGGRRGLVGAHGRGGGAPRRRRAAAAAAIGRGARRRRGPVDGPACTAGHAPRPPGLLELEQLLADQLDTRVGVQMGAKRGKVTIEFADLEDLERIYRQIAGDH